MPITNGDIAASMTPLLRGKDILDHTKALEYLAKEYSQDGLDVHTLLDSKTSGALTYNDFLILPGYIGNRLIPMP
jgi:IMP dehydrogenase